MENILENKSKFFALYYGQKVVKEPEFSESVEVDFIDFLRPEKETFLELLPLSSISDEDAIEVANIVGWVKGKNPSEYKAWIIDFFGDRSLGDRFSLTTELPVYTSLEVIDFLRSRGYALPFMGLSVEELVNRGWVKLKGE